MKEEMLNLETSQGRYVYTRSLIMMLYKAVVTEAPGLTLRVEHSISNGQFCRLYDAQGNVAPVKRQLVDRLKSHMKALVAADLPFERVAMTQDDAISVFTKEGLTEKVDLLETSPRPEVVCYRLDGVVDSYISRLADRTSQVGVFDLRLYKEGILLLGPDRNNPKAPAIPVRQTKMYRAFQQSLDFHKIIQVSCVGDLNHAVERGDTGMLINVAETMHNKILSRISDDIMRRRRHGQAQLVLLAGPSSSGKTTTCKRLAVQLMTNMMRPKMISLDDYFVNRDQTPRDEHGEYDFESLYALDLPRFNADLNALLAGKEINLPTYSFELGRRVDKPRPLRLEGNDILLIEGIHGLNPELVSEIPADRIYKVYVSALTSLRVDNHNWIPTTDNRLLRRMVRDSKYRGTSPEQTLARWPSVRRGEEKWIFPFQENADATFNSSLIFELGVMKDYLLPLLMGVPESSTYYGEARRLAEFLDCFLSIPTDQVPSNSLLREFLGGSTFHY